MNEPGCEKMLRAAETDLVITDDLRAQYQAKIAELRAEVEKLEREAQAMRVVLEEMKRERMNKPI